MFGLFIRAVNFVHAHDESPRVFFRGDFAALEPTVSKRQISRVLRKLLEAGQVIRIGHGLYAPPGVLRKDGRADAGRLAKVYENFLVRIGYKIVTPPMTRRGEPLKNQLVFVSDTRLAREIVVGGLSLRLVTPQQFQQLCDKQADVAMAA